MYKSLCAKGPIIATQSERERQSFTEGIAFTLALVLTGALVVSACLRIDSCRRRSAMYDHVSQLHEGIQAEVDPSTLAPHLGFPWVIADDDLCRITVRGTDDTRLSYHGYVLDYTLENKTDDLTIYIGDDGKWIATGEYLFAGERVDAEDIAVEYHGPINRVESGEVFDGQFGLFSPEHGSLYDIDAFRGSFEVSDSAGTLIGLYPFSYEKWNGAPAYHLPTTIVDDDVCSFEVTEIWWDEGWNCWRLSYQIENRTNQIAYLSPDGQWTIDDAQEDADVPKDQGGTHMDVWSGQTQKGSLSFHVLDQDANAYRSVTWDKDQRPQTIKGILTLRSEAEGNPVLAYIPVYLYLVS